MPSCAASTPTFSMYDLLSRSGRRPCLAHCGQQLLHAERVSCCQVVASNEVNIQMNNRDPPVFWPERTYKWGVSEAFNPEHSDLMYLRRLLLEDACEEIAAAKRKR